MAQPIPNEGETTVFADRFSNLHLWKGSPFEAQAQELFAGRESTLAAEADFTVTVDLPADPEAKAERIAKALTSVSTMKGLQVYSVSLKKMETFLFDAYRVGILDKNDRKPDPDPSTVLPQGTFLMFQNEEQTGESFARLSFSQESGWFLVTLTNLTPLNYGFIPLVAPKDLFTAVFVQPVDGKVRIYGVTVAKTVQFFGLERSRTASLYTRMKALVIWLTQNLEAKS